MVYRDIRKIPIKKWFDVYEQDSFKPLCKFSCEYELPYFNKKWDRIMDQYINEFGLDEETVEKIELKKRFIITFAKMKATKNRYLQNELDIILNDIKALQKENKQKLSKLVSVLEKNYGIAQDENMSAYTFFRRINSL